MVWLNFEPGLRLLREGFDTITQALHQRMATANADMNHLRREYTVETGNHH